MNRSEVKAVFIDQEVILARNNSGNGTLITAAHFDLQERAVGSVNLLKQSGLLVVMTGNQPEVGAGTFPLSELRRLHAHVRAHLRVDDICCCQHEADDECDCRKPRILLFTEAARKWNIDLGSSFVLGAHIREAAVAERIGATSVIIRCQNVDNVHRDVVVADLSAAVTKIRELAVRVAR